MPEFRIETLAPQPFAYISRSAALPDMPKVMGEGFGTLGALFAKAKAQMMGPPLAHYLSFRDGRATFDMGFPVRAEDTAALKAAGLSVGQTPGGAAMKAIHVGPYDTVSRTYDAMGNEMRLRNIAGTEDMWERYLSGPEVQPTEIRTEVIWPVKQSGS
jgi:hypothetical protein